MIIKDANTTLPPYFGFWFPIFETKINPEFIIMGYNCLGHVFCGFSKELEAIEL